MRVLILTSCATADRTFAIDEEYELDDAVAHELIRAGLAQAVMLPFEPDESSGDELAASVAHDAVDTTETVPRRRGRPRKRS